MNRAIKDFVFTGFLGSHAVKELESRGLLRVREGSPADQIAQDLFAPVPETLRSASLYMQRQYRLLYVLENTVRDFVSSRFTELDGDNWFEGRATPAMKKKLESRKVDEEKNQWHTGRNKEPLFYLDFGDLNLLIKNHWPVFSDFFDSQTWIASRLEDAERTRNVIGHTNVLDVDEAQRLEMYLQDLLKQLG